MLAELRIRELGVIAGVDLVLRPGMTAVTGETGAGKTLLVQAIDLLLGGRAEGILVRAGAAQAEVEGRFVLKSRGAYDDHAGDAGRSDPTGDDITGDDITGDDTTADDTGHEVVLGRVVPVAGRSRGYLNGRMAPASVLSGKGRRLVDIHGQHAHQSLLAPAVQRRALDTFGGVDHTARTDALRRLAGLDEALEALGGDERSRAREIDLLRFQTQELAAAALADPDEDEVLVGEEERLAQAAATRDAAACAYHALSDDGGGADAVGSALAALAGRPHLAGPAARLGSVAAELADVAADLRHASETFEDDPERLAQIRARRTLLGDLRRKYGDSLRDVMAYAVEADARLAELGSHSERIAALEQQRSVVQAELERAGSAMRAARHAAAARFSVAVAEHLQDLAMPGARIEVTVGDTGAGDEVAFLLGANQGEPCLPLNRVASGGELARTMLALRLVLGHHDSLSPATVIFDEVDAGVGGEAALAVGRALAAVASPPAAPQVLVVTHLPQVAAFADHQLVVRKKDVEGRTVVEVHHVEGEARVVELSRMLSGQPDSATARGHAQELLAVATRGRRT
ncbi:MAG TPA: DNA repair protein RecN [Acidimicrobiales bacterium]|nr:DNA repair protein RecN [Acidimicrobiales bacterium]